MLWIVALIATYAADVQAAAVSDGNLVLSVTNIAILVVNCYVAYRSMRDQNALGSKTLALEAVKVEQQDDTNEYERLDRLVGRLETRLAATEARLVVVEGERDAEAEARTEEAKARKELAKEIERCEAGRAEMVATIERLEGEVQRLTERLDGGGIE